LHAKEDILGHEVQINHIVQTFGKNYIP